MPIYVYELLDDAGDPTGDTFEIHQSMKDDALKKHPETGQKVRRAVTLPNVAGKWSDMKSKSAMSNDNLERLGFTKYERKGKGYMERVAGKEGPQTLGGD